MISHFLTIAWLLMNNWLESFAFRVKVDVPTLALAGLLAGLIALLTVSYPSIRAALSDPVSWLKNE